VSTEHALLVGTGPDSLRTIQQTVGTAVVQTEVVAEPNLSITSPTASSVTGSDGIIVAASSGIRPIVVSVPTSADTGIYVNFDAAATSSNFLVEAGGRLLVNTAQAIHAIRAGASNVTAYVLTGVLP